MLRKNFLCLLLTMAIALMGFAAYAATDKEVVIGLSVPLSGPYELQGKDQLNAYALAREEINKQGGILGRKIRFLISDSKTNAKLAAKNVEKFVEQGVDMVTGGSSSGEAVAVSKVCQEKKKLFMATLTYSNDTTGKDGHRHCFRETYNSWMAAKALAPYLKKHYPNRRYFFITSDYTWGWTTRDSMMRFTGSTGSTDILMPLGTPLGSPLYKSAIQKALDEKAQVLVLSLFGEDLIAALQEAINLGARDKMVMIAPNLEMYMTLGSPQHPVAGVLGTVPWNWDIPEKYNYENGIKFVNAFRARYGRPPGTAAGIAYTDMMLYKWAVEHTKSFDPKRLIVALEGHGFIGLKDPEYFRPWDHQAIQTVYVVRGKSKEEMKSMWDVFDYLDAVGGEDLAPTDKENPVKLEPLD